VGGASLSWARCSVRFLTFNMEVDGGSTGTVTNVSRFGDKGGVRNMCTTGAPFLDSANLGPLLAG